MTQSIGREKLTLAELIETDFVKCDRCSDNYTDPVLLPCLHSFCAKCVSALSSENKGETTNQTTICSTNVPQEKHDQIAALNSEVPQEVGGAVVLLCPICISPIVPPDKGVYNFPDNLFLRHLVELYRYKHDSKRTCDYCKYDGKTKDATSRCLDCDDDICDSCSEAHRRTKVTRGHLVVPYKQIQNGLYDHDVRTYQVPTCVCHTEEKVCMFCDKCEVLACNTCKSSDHHGHKMSELDQAVPRYKLQMESLLAGLKRQIPSIGEYKAFLTKYKQSTEDTKLKLFSDLENQANTLHTMIDDHKSWMMERISAACIEEISVVEKKIYGLERATQSLDENAEYLSHLIGHGQATELLTLHQQVTSRLTQLVHMQLDGINKKLKMGFSPTCPTKDNITRLFGTLALGHVPLSDRETNILSDTGSLGMSSTLLPNVKNQVEHILTFSSKCDSDVKDVWPTGVAITTSNDIVIADRDNKNIKIFSNLGVKKLEFYGKDNGKLGTPFDVTVLQNSNIAVTDRDCEDVKVFTQTGEFVYSIKDHFKNPRGISTNKKGQIVVVDCNLLQITIHDPCDGKLVNTIKARVEGGSNALVDPFYVTVNSMGNLIVTDTAAPNIKVFTPQGAYLSQHGTYGTRSDQSLQPYGVCCDSYGYLFVADNHNDRIHLLHPDGRFKKFLLGKSEGLWHPMGVAISNNGYLVVTEALGQVKVFRYV